MTDVAEYIGVLSPQIILLLFALVCPALDLWLRLRKGIAYWALTGFVLVGVIETLALIPATSSWFSFLQFQEPPGTAVLEISAFSQVFTVVFVFVGALVALASPSFISKEKNHGEYYALLLIAVTGMTFVASAADLIVIFVGLEIGSVATYALTAFQKKVRRSTEAAMKFFIVGGFSSAIMLFGISLVYGMGGSTNLAELGTRLVIGAETDIVVLLAIVMLIVGIGFKIAAVPFHMWAPDVYEGAPTTITALLAAGSKKMGVAAMFKLFLVALLAHKANWDVALGAIAILTMTVGNLIAIQQSSVKRMLAYSSIAQAGYILIAFPIATDYAVAGGILHVITHAAMKAGAFFVIIALAVRGFGETFRDFDGLGKRSPFLAFSMAVFMLSLAGIPPLAGFYSKFVLFSAAVFESSNTGWLIWLAVAGILNSALSLFYYAKVIKAMYAHEAPPESSARLDVPSLLKIAIFIALAATFVIGVYPQPFIDGALGGAQQLNDLLPHYR